MEEGVEDRRLADRRALDGRAIAKQELAEAYKEEFGSG